MNRVKEDYMQAPYSQEQLNAIAHRAHTLYDNTIRAQVEPEHIGEFLAVDVESGDYELDSEALAATQRVRGRRPDGVFFLLRVGYPAAYSLGGYMSRESS